MCYRHAEGAVGVAINTQPLTPPSPGEAPEPSSTQSAVDPMAPADPVGGAMSVLFAFAASVTAALTAVTQHVASTSAAVEVKGWRLALYLVRSPLWLFGVASTLASFVFQAIALYH